MFDGGTYWPTTSTTKQVSCKDSNLLPRMDLQIRNWFPTMAGMFLGVLLNPKKRLPPNDRCLFGTPNLATTLSRDSGAASCPTKSTRPNSPFGLLPVWCALVFCIEVSMCSVFFFHQCTCPQSVLRASGNSLEGRSTWYVFIFSEGRGMCRLEG